MRALSGILIVGMSLGGCFYMPVVSKGKVSALDEAPRLATAISSTESKAISTYDPNSKVATTIPAPTGALAGSSVTLQAGALSIAVDLVVEEAVPLTETSLTNSLAISSNIAIMPVGSGLIIRPTENVDLTKPLTIAMPVSPTAGLHTWLSGVMAMNADKNYVVFYKYFFEGELRAGLIPSDVLRKGADGSILFEGYFGAYWLAEVSEPIKTKVEILTTEPIMNKDKVAVISNAGVVTETEIVAKAAIPVVNWKSIALTADLSTRSVTATASIGSERTVSSCILDLFEKTDASTGINIETGSTLNKSYSVVKMEAHTLYGRFRCIDDQQRLTLSGWSLAVTMPGTIATMADLCGVNPPDLRFFIAAMDSASVGAPKPVITLVEPTQAPTTMPIPSLNYLRSFTANGACVYTLEVDTMSDIAFAIQTGDGKTNCSSSTTGLGTVAATCSAATGSLAPMTLPRGNYNFKLDFSGSRTNPKLSIALQDCGLGDMYMVHSDYYNYTWPTPTATDKMTHLGGCQYAIQLPPSGSGYTLRIQNDAGTYMCGEQTTLQPGYPAAISCGASRPGFTQPMMGGNVIGYRYVVNLGNNLDMHGQTTNQPYVSYTEVDNCMNNLFILGPTSAGQSRIVGINDFHKNSYCSFRYAWANSTSFTPFYIGVGDGTQKCGVAPGSYPSMSTSLDCSSNAIPIDMQSFASIDSIYSLSLNYDSYTGLPNYLSLMQENPLCGDMFYLVKDGSAGVQPSSAKAFTEVKECIYQYDWTPSVGDHDMMFLAGGNAGWRCGRFPGNMNPVVSGAPTDISCNSQSLSTNFPLTPTGIADGSTYRVTLDMRLMLNGLAKVSIAPRTATACPALHVVGLPDYGGMPSPSNEMTRSGDCNYNFKFHAPYSSSLNFKIQDASSTFTCGRDINAAYAYPDSNGRNVNMDCSGMASDLYVNVNQDADYQIQVHYEAGGTSTVGFNSYYNYGCSGLVLDGPAGPYQSMFGNSFTSVDTCVDELLWVPTNSVASFRLKQPMYYSVDAYCGLENGESPLSVSGVERSALCYAFNVANTNNFTVNEGVVPNQKYLIHVDRKGIFFAPPKVSVQPVTAYFPDAQGSYQAGYQGVNIVNTETYPSSRESAAVWTDPSSNARYMFGGYGINEAGSIVPLADLWRLDALTGTWTLLPVITPPDPPDYGTPNGYIYNSAIGEFHAENRPSARHSALAIFDPSGSGKLWLFGGQGKDTSGSVGLLNDLWVYDLTLNQWALMSGTFGSVNNLGAVGSIGTPSHSDYPGSRSEASGWIDNTGRIFVFGGWGYADAGAANTSYAGRLGDLWVFDPSAAYTTNTWTLTGGFREINQQGNISQPSGRNGAMAWKDSNDRFWLFGGLGYRSNVSPGSAEGRLNDLWTYNYSNNTWIKVGGSPYVEQYGNNSIRGVSSKRAWPSSRSHASAWKGVDGTFWMFGGDARTSSFSMGGLVNDIWRFDPVTQEWTWIPGSTQYSSGMEYTLENQTSVVGPMGDMGNGYRPGSRKGAMAWGNQNGNVWIFGGLGYAPGYAFGDLQDLWYLDL